MGLKIPRLHAASTIKILRPSFNIWVRCPGHRGGGGGGGSGGNKGRCLMACSLSW